MFLDITEDEAAYILGAIGRVRNPGDDWPSDFGYKLCEKIGANLTVGELHLAERTYRQIKFSRQADYSVNFVECYYDG